MKTIILIIAFAISTLGISQTWNDTMTMQGFGQAESTTEKEYNYLTKGMKVAAETGLDIINGYKLLPCTKTTIDGFTFDVNYLALKENSKIKAMSIVINSPKLSYKIYLCVPYNNIELSKQYYASIPSSVDGLRLSYMYLFSDLLMRSSGYFTNK